MFNFAEYAAAWQSSVSATALRCSQISLEQVENLARLQCAGARQLHEHAATMAGQEGEWRARSEQLRAQSSTEAQSFTREWYALATTAQAQWAQLAKDSLASCGATLATLDEENTALARATLEMSATALGQLHQAGQQLLEYAQAATLAAYPPGG